MASSDPIASTAPLSLREIAALLVKHHNLHDGLWDLSIEFQIGLGAFGPSPSEMTPGGFVGIKTVGLQRAQVQGPHTVNAADLNPASR
jgi:hypothetical protein